MNYVNPESDGLLAYWRMNAWEAKDGGGNIVVTGTPEEVAACEASYTGRYLKRML